MDLFDDLKWTPGSLDSMVAFDQYHSQGRLLIGIDEAGRGPLAGPVVAAAVAFAPETDWSQLAGLTDSKQMNAAQRERLYPVIQHLALGVGVGQASPREIERDNILQATFKAMIRALEDPALALIAETALVDGNHLPNLPIPAKAIPKADAYSVCVAAASVIAKVTRDRLMELADDEYPQYGFAIHKGYGTELHRNALSVFGPCPIHRHTFEPIVSQTELPPCSDVFMTLWELLHSPQGAELAYQFDEMASQTSAMSPEEAWLLAWKIKCLRKQTTHKNTTDDNNHAEQS